MEGSGAASLVKTEFVNMKNFDPETCVTVASLIEWLREFRPNQRVIFGCKELEFKTIKEADDYVVIEFAQSVYCDPPGKIIVVDHQSL